MDGVVVDVAQLDGIAGHFRGRGGLVVLTVAAETEGLRPCFALETVGFGRLTDMAKNRRESKARCRGFLQSTEFVVGIDQLPHRFEAVGLQPD